MEITFTSTSEKFTTTIKDKNSYIYKLLSTKTNENHSNEFDIDEAFSKVSEDDQNKENVIHALNYLTKKSLYKTIRGLEFLGLLEENIEILDQLKHIKYDPEEYFSPYISSVIMKHFGVYKTLVMITKGLLLNYEGDLSVQNEQITQELLDTCQGCLTIYKLNARNNSKINNIDFCAETLEELEASRSCGIDQKGIKNATKLKKLDAWYNPKINSVDFCAETLEELDASGDCGIDQTGIQHGTKLKILHAKDNSKINNIDFCASTLEELWAYGSCGIDQNGIQHATKLKKLNVWGSTKINSVDFCAETLEELEASRSCSIDQNGIKHATKLKILSARDNSRIKSIDFCAETLEELNASDSCGIDQIGIQKADKLKILYTWRNPKITTNSFFI